MQDQPTPYGYCQCGCGQRTSLMVQTESRIGLRKGEPRRFMPGHSRRRRQPVAIVDAGYRTPCWLWNGSRDYYGHCRRGGRSVGAHRAFYEDAHGPIPEGLEIDHLCRNPGCVNPEHLEAVTTAENQRRGRAASVSQATVEAVKLLLDQGWVQADIARAYGIGGATVTWIKQGKHWRTRT